MKLDKVITVKVNDNYLKMLEEIKDYETSTYHFMGNNSALIRLLIFQRYDQILEEKQQKD